MIGIGRAGESAIDDPKAVALYLSRLWLSDCARLSVAKDVSRGREDVTQAQMWHRVEEWLPVLQKAREEVARAQWADRDEGKRTVSVCSPNCKASCSYSASELVERDIA